MPEADENVLVVPRELIAARGLFQGLCFDIDRYLSVLLDGHNHRFIPRREAEQNPELKQLIPYFVICFGDEIWSYTRGKKSGEGRLVSRVSIGIGGHINNLDANLFEDIYSRAATRELEEEVTIVPGWSQRIVALLNDDSTPVGSVHLGVVHVLMAATPDVRKNESAITDAGFKTITDLRAVRDRMETWSQLCLDQIERLLVLGRG